MPTLKTAHTAAGRTPGTEETRERADVMVLSGHGPEEPTGPNARTPGL
ncbi:hypothetical protein [Streptomyces galilaeus]|nr:hypothetical protein [Streptomyces galilaeus]